MSIVIRRPDEDFVPPRDPLPVAAAASPCAQSWALTHPGSVRPDNQDSLLSRPDLGLWMVADGVGGHAGGAVASQAIAAALAGLHDDMADTGIVQQTEVALQNIHAELRNAAQAKDAHATIASTVVVLVLRGMEATCLWVGDSRAYRFRNRQLSLLTRDHSLVQELISAGTITADQARCHPRRNIITRAIGAPCEQVAIERVSDRAQPGDLYLLCSDGLSGTLSEDEIAVALSLRADLAVDSLVTAALAHHAPDNVTAIVIAVGQAPE